MEEMTPEERRVLLLAIVNAKQSGNEELMNYLISLAENPEEFRRIAQTSLDSLAGNDQIA